MSKPEATLIVFKANDNLNYIIHIPQTNIKSITDNKNGNEIKIDDLKRESIHEINYLRRDNKYYHKF